MAVQGLAYVLDMGVFIGLTNVALTNPITSNVMSKLCAGIFAFILQRSFTFKVVNGHNVKRQAILYFLILFMNIPIASGVLTIFLIKIKEPSYAKFLSDIACILISYALCKYLIFPKSKVSIY